MSAVLDAHRDSGDLSDPWQGDATSVIEFLRPLREQLDSDGVLEVCVNRPGELLVETLLAPKLASRNPQRRKEAVESLERMATVLSELKHALLVRDLRRLADG